MTISNDEEQREETKSMLKDIRGYSKWACILAGMVYFAMGFKSCKEYDRHLDLKKRLTRIEQAQSNLVNRISGEYPEAGR